MKLIKSSIEERMKHYNVNGLSMTCIENGRISGTEYYGLLEVNSERKVNENSVFSACSISKFLTGMIALKLIDEGLIGLDEDVNEKLVTWKVPENDFLEDKKVTLRNLLCHQSGIKDPDKSFPEWSSHIGIPSMAALLEGETPCCTRRIEVQCEPESEFYYSDAGFCLIQQLIEDVTNNPYDKMVDELIFTPLGMTNSHLHIPAEEMDNKEFSCGHDQKGDYLDGKYPIYPYPASSGLWTTSDDLALLVIELMNALKGESAIGISACSAKEMITAQLGKSWTGLGVFLEGSGEELEITSLGWGKGFQCMMAAYPHAEKGAIIMTNADLGVHQSKGIIGDIYRSLMSS